MHDPRILLDRALDAFGARLVAVPTDGWDAPTPCPGWSVQDLVAHVVDEERWVPSLLAGESTQEHSGDRHGDELDADPVAAWRQAATDVRSAIADSGVVDATVRIASGETTAATLLLEVFADHLIHAWDLARAIGADERLDADLVEACATWFDEHEREWRENGEIGPPVAVPEGADAQARLLARFGRDPRAPARPER